MTKTSKNLLLISGSGRNVGKTSFIREVIAQNANQNLVAIKITPHFHEATTGLISVAVTDHFQIYLETNLSSVKDSSLFLQAGAEKVFYIQTNDSDLEEAFSIVLKHVKPDQPIVTESAALRKFFSPGLYLFIQDKNKEGKSSAIEMQKIADTIVDSDGKQFSLNPRTITFKQLWKINDIA